MLTLHRLTLIIVPLLLAFMIPGGLDTPSHLVDQTKHSDLIMSIMPLKLDFYSYLEYTRHLEVSHG